jgi:glycosyltransferase involved in cell wall biosynthesis
MDKRVACYLRNEQFQKSIPEAALVSTSAVIGFDTASWVLSKRCAQREIPFILDRSTPHPDAKLCAYELVRHQYPEWETADETRLSEVRAAEQEEHDRASMIVVGSTFAARTLTDNGVPADKIRVNPYGVDCDRFYVAKHEQTRPFRFLFVGPVSARKGLALLVDAWRKISGAGAELWRIGSGSDEARRQIPFLKGLRDFGRAPDVAEMMRQCDVFVLPTYFEGFALVILEAMASGLPVITTTASGAVGVISDGKDGWLLERGDLNGLIEKMNYCLENRRLIRDMGHRSRITAERFSWFAYGDRWMQFLAELFK